MEQLKQLYDIITRDGYIEQKVFLEMFSEDVPREERLRELFALEQQGLIVSKLNGKDVVYYLADTVFH